MVPSPVNPAGVDFSCQALRAWYQQQLDQNQYTPPHTSSLLMEVPENFRSHLAKCPQCREYQAGFALLRRGLTLLTPPPPPPHLKQQLVRAVMQRKRGQSQFRRRLSYGLAAAALVAITFGVQLYWPMPGTEKQPGGGGLARRLAPTEVQKPTQPPSPGRPRETLGDSVAEASSVVASLTNRTADQTVGTTRMFLPEVPSLSASGPVEPGSLPATTPPFREAGQGVSAGLAPVTDSARRALGLFLRDIPMDLQANKNNREG